MHLHFIYYEGFNEQNAFNSKSAFLYTLQGRPLIKQLKQEYKKNLVRIMAAECVDKGNNTIIELRTIFQRKVKTHKHINRHNQSTTEKLGKTWWPWLGTGISKEMVRDKYEKELVWGKCQGDNTF